MSAFVAKMKKNTYQNYKFLKQRTKMNDEQLFAFMVDNLAKTVNNAIEQGRKEAEDVGQETTNP